MFLKSTPLRTDPTDIARRDHLEFFVENIISFKGDIRKVTTVTFLVKWLGYDDTYNTFEPWKSLMNNEHLHEFLIQHNLRNLIPRKYLLNYSNYTKNNATTTSVATEQLSKEETGRCSRIRYTRYSPLGDIRYTRFTVYPYTAFPYRMPV